MTARTLLPLLALLLGVPLAAQTGASKAPALEAHPPSLVTDRPDQTESSAIVPPGYVQIETGWLFTRNHEEGARQETHEFPGTLVRIGLLDWLELRAGWSGHIREEVRLEPLRANANGMGDAELSTKIRFWPQKGGRPETALLVGTSLPVGDKDFSSDRFDPSVRFSLSHSLSERFSLGYNLGMQWTSAAHESGNRTTLSDYIYTAVLGIGLTERLGAFAEVFGEIPASAVGKPANALDGGFTYLLRPNLQLDVTGGAGLSGRAVDWFVGAGFSLRLPE